MDPTPTRCSAVQLQALHCVEVMSLLMKQHLRTLVEAGLHAYLQMWLEYDVEPDSLAAYAGERGQGHGDGQVLVHCAQVRRSRAFEIFLFLFLRCTLAGNVCEWNACASQHKPMGFRKMKRESPPPPMLRCAGYPDSATPQHFVSAHEDANLAWKLSRRQQLTAWGSDLFCPSPPPMFQLQLLLRDDELLFLPSLEEVQHTVLGIVHAVIQAGQSVDDLGAKVIMGGLCGNLCRAAAAVCAESCVCWNPFERILSRVRNGSVHVGITNVMKAGSFGEAFWLCGPVVGAASASAPLMYGVL